MKDRIAEARRRAVQMSAAEFERGRGMREEAVDAVCTELGIPAGAAARRAAVADRVEAAYRMGRRQPLYLVDAGLGAGWGATG